MNRRIFIRTTALPAATTRLPAAPGALRTGRRRGVTLGFNAPNGYFSSAPASCLEAVGRVFAPEPRWPGLCRWKWEEQSDRPQFKDDPAGDKGFLLHEPATEVFRTWSERLS